MWMGVCTAFVFAALVEFTLGMLPNKMSVTTILDHKHFKDKI